MNKRNKAYFKAIVLVLFFVVIVILSVRGYLSPKLIRETLESFRQSSYSQFFPLIYIALYILGVIFAIPGVALTLLSGPLFGFWQGLLLVVIGSNLGCQLTFVLSRFLGKDFVERMIPKDSRVEKIFLKTESNGFLFMLYMRLLPLFPFNLVNYISGLTKIKYWQYTLATFIGMLPGTIIYVQVSVAATNAGSNPWGLVISVAILIVFTVAIKLFKIKP